MLTELMSLEIHIRFEDDEFLVQTFPVGADEVVPLEVNLQSVVVQIIMRLPRVPSVAEEATLVFVTTMFKQLVIVVKPLAAEAAQWVAVESGRVTGAVISVAHVLS